MITPILSTTKFVLPGGEISSFAPSLATDNSPTEIPSSAAVKAMIDSAIAEVEAGSGTTLTGWINVLTYGVVMNGSSSGGTDNTIAINAAISACPNNGVIYFPPGGCRHTTIIIPRTKKVHIRSLSTHWVGNNDAFIWDGNGHTAVFDGEVNGTDQSTANYTGLTNSGLYLRNTQGCVIKALRISGFHNAIKLGGATSLPVPGNQYNKIQFDNIYRNYRGVLYSCVGNSWCNSNQLVGGQLCVKEGVRFTKGSGQTDPYNQNIMYGFGFEHGGNYPDVMDTAICGEFANSNFWISGRIEGGTYGPIGDKHPIITTKVNLDGTCNGNAWVNWFWQDSWCSNMGNAAFISGVIWSEVDGIPLGNEVYGYPPISYSGTPSPVNGRMYIKARRRTFTAAANVPVNVDIIWEQDTWSTASSGAYTVPYGIDLVYANNTGSIVLPDALRYFGRTVRIFRETSGTTTINVNGTTVTLDAPGEWLEVKALGTTSIVWRVCGGKY